ncbi:MAG: glycosyltransferase [Alteromonadaceae bacterium]|nr:glycosyltransferase [Alteromonadaceae bacterium]
MKNSFSVLMSIYVNDDVGFLREAFESLVKQSVLFEELVVVCDGEITDEQESVLADYEKKFALLSIAYKNPRLKINQGLGNALNFGSGFCTQKYIVRMDSDDISTIDRIEKLTAVISQYPNADVVGALIEEFNSNPGDLGIKRVVPEGTASIFNYSKIRNPMNHVTACIKKDSLDRVGGDENVLWHEDYYLWIKMLRLGMELRNVHDVHVFVRVGELGGRRNGIKYLRSEFNFLKRCLSIGHFSLLNTISYMLPRLSVRLMPAGVTAYIYKFLRSAK